MGFFDREFYSRRFTTLHQAIQRVSTRAPKLSAQRLKGVILISASLLLGITARNITQLETLANWEKEHPPSLDIWRASFSAYGLSEVEKAFEKYRALRTLPTVSDQVGAVWTSSDSLWVTVFAKKDGVIEPFVFGRDPKNAPAQWAPQGAGWTAFEKILEILRKVPAAPLPVVSSPVQQNRTQFHDPRAIAY